MKGLKDLLLAEKFHLEQIIKEVKIRLVQAPEVRLRLSKSQSYPQYYQCTDLNTRVHYTHQKSYCRSQSHHTLSGQCIAEKWPHHPDEERKGGKSEAGRLCTRRDRNQKKRFWVYS